MKIAMLARNANLYSHQRLKEAAEARGHTLDILNTLRCTVHIASHRPEVYYNGAPIAAYDAVIPRIGASVTAYGAAVLRQFQARGTWIVNPPEGIVASRDKLHAHQILARHQILMPETAFASSPKDTANLISLVGGAPLNEEFGKAVGADAYCRDAGIAVETAKTLIAARRAAARA